jgi:hypothetical protein
MDSLQLLAMIFALSLNPANAAADSQGVHAAKNTGPQRTAALTGQVAFGSRDRRLIQEYYRTGAPSAAQRLENKDSSLQRNATLPDGIEKRYLPPALASKLSPLPSGYERVIIGRDIALIDTSTHTVIDIIYGVSPS